MPWSPILSQPETPRGAACDHQKTIRMRRELWLLRHGETAWSRTGQHTGREDLPLTELGEQEALEAARLLNGRPFARVLCSPLQRARRTCQLAGYLEQARIEPLAMEWDYGEWNGLTRAQIQERIPGWNIWTGPVPGGESLHRVAERAREVLDGLSDVEGDVAIFAHGHFLRILTTRFLGLAPGAARHFALATASAGVLGIEYGFPAILRWNIKA